MFEDTVDPCNPDPCMNGATCIADGTDYSCDCPTEFTGTNCETGKAMTALGGNNRKINLAEGTGKKSS